MRVTVPTVFNLCVFPELRVLSTYILHVPSVRMTLTDYQYLYKYV